ncbi:MAG: N-acetyl-alpha-D-glucosaminyl L-malate synthase BshA [Bacteroidota bacterium]
MNIGISCYPTYGGSGVVATELAIALAKRGHQVHIISYALPMRLDTFMENIFFHEVEIASYPVLEFPLYTTALASKIVEVAKFAKLDLIHVHYAIPHATSAYLAKKIIGDKLKVITTLHGTDITLVGLEPSFLPVMKFSIEESDGVTAVSNYLKIETENHYKIQKNINVIYNFVDTNKYQKILNPDLRKVFAPKNENILIHTSNFRPVKRVTDVIKIFNQVKKENPTKLILIGDGPERSTCEKLTRDLGIDKDTFFLGKQSEIVNILSLADVFLLPSEMESFGLSALEAMSCEVPVVSSNAGGLPEVNINNKTGFCHEIGDVNEMANSVLNILNDKKLHRNMSLESRKNAVDNFSMEKIISQYEDFYKSFLENN